MAQIYDARLKYFRYGISMLQMTYTAVQGLRFSCYSWDPGYHSWTRVPRHPVHITDIYATESRTPLVRELSADRFAVGLLLHCSPPSRLRAGGMGKGVWRPGTAVRSSQCGKTTHLLALQITTNSSSLQPSTQYCTHEQWSIYKMTSNTIN